MQIIIYILNSIKDIILRFGNKTKRKDTIFRQFFLESSLACIIFAASISTVTGNVAGET